VHRFDLIVRVPEGFDPHHLHTLFDALEER
jgi:hypothetical protein